MTPDKEPRLRGKEGADIEHAFHSSTGTPQNCARLERGTLCHQSIVGAKSCLLSCFYKRIFVMQVEP